MSTQILQAATKYSLYSGSIIFASGVIGNVLNVLVLTQLKMFRDNRSAFYLTVESTSNFFSAFLQISLTILTSIYGDDGTGRWLIWCKLRYIVSQILTLTTFSMICLAAVDQYFSTNYRANMRQMCTLKLARCLTFAFFCLWIVHSAVFGIYFNIGPSVGCVISNPICLQYASYFFYPVLSGFLPIIIAFSFSLFAFRNVRRIVRRQLPIVRRRLDQQMTAMVLLRVLAFVCLVTPYITYRVYTINVPISPTKPMAYAIGRLLQAIFSSCISLNYSVKLSTHLIHICDILICFRLASMCF
jgi:hypothetical protein